MKRIETLFQTKPFFEDHEFVGTLSKNNSSADKLHIMLTYSEIKGGKVVGKVLGNNKSYKSIHKLSLLPGLEVKLSSEDAKGSNVSFSSEKVIIENIKGFVNRSAKMTYKVADLRLMDLTIKHTLKLYENESRSLTFCLSGPETLWNTRADLDVSDTGEEKIRVQKNLEIVLSESFPFEIQIRPEYFYDEITAEEKIRLKTGVHALVFTTKIPKIELSDEVFIEETKAVVDDLTLLVSFLSRRWVMWYKYELITGESVLTHVRTTRECSNEEVGYFDSVVDVSQSREFLKIAFTSLRTLRKGEINLNMPLTYFISSREAKYLEEKFSGLFLSLERIKDMFVRKEKLHENLKSKPFKKFASSLRNTIRNEIIDVDTAKKITDKIPELNRPSLRTVVELLFEKYEIPWQDLYPPGSEVTLIKIRDKLFHSSDVVETEQLYKEELRLQTLLERLFLSMLGWKDFSYSPANHKKSWLTTISPVESVKVSFVD